MFLYLKAWVQRKNSLINVVHVPKIGTFHFCIISAIEKEPREEELRTTRGQLKGIKQKILPTGSKHDKNWR